MDLEKFIKETAENITTIYKAGMDEEDIYQADKRHCWEQDQQDAITDGSEGEE